jgi:hydroxyacylglutathione hydrolase
MIIKRLFETKLAQTSYLIGCLEHREAIVIDPNRDAEQYLKLAEAEGVRIAHVTETHIHADYLSGSRELASRTGATLYLSDEGDESWKYQFAGEPNVKRLKHGDRITVGNVLIDVLHTPGHTPEHLTFLVTDGLVANEPIGAATGDFIFVGDVGRPDLLERAAHVAGTMETSAKTLYRSLQTFESRPDWLQIWPGHGAGSACGKGISAIPQSTLGYERRFNWALQPMSETDFVRRVLTGQPEPPKYFAEMKRLNKEGPRILHGFRRPELLDAGALEHALAADALVVDTRPAVHFAAAHVPGTICIPLNKSFTTYAGWLVPFTGDFYVIVDDSVSGAIDTVVRDLAMIGLDRIAGYFDAAVIDQWSAAGRPLGQVQQITAMDLRQSVARGAVTVVDVRNQVEWDEGHIPGAQHIPLGYLPDRLGEIPRSKPIVVQCQTGARSMIGASLLQSHGIETAINLAGGLSNWQSHGFDVRASEAETRSFTADAKPVNL